MPLDRVAACFASSDEDSLPVVDAGGTLRGILHRRDLSDALATDMPDATAGDLMMRHPTPLRPDLSLEEALELLVANGDALPGRRRIRQRGPAMDHRTRRTRDLHRRGTRTLSHSIAVEATAPPSGPASAAAAHTARR